MFETQQLQHWLEAKFISQPYKLTGILRDNNVYNILTKYEAFQHYHFRKSAESPL